MTLAGISTGEVTHHYRMIVSTSYAKNHSGSFIGDPAGRYHHLSLVPHPADEISQSVVLRDVIVTRRNRHIDHRASLNRRQHWELKAWPFSMIRNFKSQFLDYIKRSNLSKI